MRRDWGGSSTEEKLLDWLLHKDTHEDSKTNLDDLTIY